MQKVAVALYEDMILVQCNRQSIAGQNPILFTPDAADAAGPW